MKKKTLTLLCAVSLLWSMSGCRELQLDAPPPPDNTEHAAETDAQTPAPAQNQKEGGDPDPNKVIVSPPSEPISTPAPNESPAQTATVTQTSPPASMPTESKPDAPTAELISPPLTESDIEMTIEEGDIVPLGTKSLNLRYRYVGDAIYAEYGFGCEYTLEKKGEDGSWRTVPFSENAAFNELGYLIGTESPNQLTDVSLSEEFYAEPLTAGQYRVVKPIDGNVTLTAEFELAEICGLPTVEKISEESGSMTLEIHEIHADGFDCALPWPYPARYFVECDPTEYPDYCIGDTIEVEYAPMYQSGEWNYYLIPTAIEASDYQLDETMDAKPVIYLYPEQETEVEVRLDYRGRLTVTYPEYRDGWRVMAKPDGTLTDADGNEYSYLFWEGVADTAYDFREGFCVRGCDTAEFLREKLALLGLTPREYNEFIVYWLPKMKDNPYNVISFQGEAYTDNAALSVSPAPDTTLRVFMAYYPSETPTAIPEQKLDPTERKGFTLVEWGGTECTR